MTFSRVHLYVCRNCNFCPLIFQIHVKGKHTELIKYLYVCSSIECSGVHRSLGVHYSKVRSLTLDAWEPEILKVMAELGNSIVNKVYEANIDPEFARATPKCHG